MRVVAILAAAVAPAFAPALAPALAPGLAPALAAAPVAELVTAPARGAVTAVSVAPAERGTDVVIQVDRAVDVQDFVLESPYRVVLDLAGANLNVATDPYDRVTRGGVVNVRLSQFRAGIVRVVVELDGKRRYRVERDGNAVRLAIAGTGSEFAPWRAGDTPAAIAAVREAAQPSPVTEPAPAAPAAQQVAAHAAPRAEATHVEPARTEPARTEPARTEPARAAPRTPVARTAPRMTVAYQDAGIRDVVAAFAAFSGRTIIVGKDIDGTVTAEIKDQPWDVALRALLKSQGLAATEEPSGIITIESYKNIATTQAVEPLVTQIVDVNYAKAASLVKIVESLLSRDCGDAAGTAGAAAAPAASPGVRACVVRGAVTADTATNKLLISDVPSNLPQIVARLQELDIRTPQVAIKAKIIFVNRTGLEDIGVSYDLGSSSQFFQKLVQRTDPSTRKPVDTNGDGVPDALGGGTAYEGDRVSLGGNALSALANADRGLTPSALNLIYSASLGRFALTAFLNALQQTQLADVQSEPSIVTLNNRTAEIFVGQQIPIRVIDASSGGSGGGASGGAGGGGFPRATVRLEEAGIRLSVTPQVTNNRRIVLNVKAENSNAQIGASDVGVIFNRQRAENQLLVGDGETAVIGGLTVTEVSKSKTGIPFLVDLPLLGRLFGQTTTSEVKRDLLILVTPHILDEGEAAPIPGPARDR